MGAMVDMATLARGLLKLMLSLAMEAMEAMVVITVDTEDMVDMATLARDLLRLSLVMVIEAMVDIMVDSEDMEVLDTVDRFICVIVVTKQEFCCNLSNF